MPLEKKGTDEKRDTVVATRFAGSVGICFLATESISLAAVS